MLTRDLVAEGCYDRSRFRVVTVARTLGAGGEEIALNIARRLGFRYVDDQIIVRAAEEAGVPPDVIDQAEHDEPTIAQVLAAIAVPTEAGPPRHATMPALSSDAYRILIRRVIDETAAEGGVVIVAHGAGIHLAGRGDVLRVLITGSVARRTLTLAERLQIGENEASEQIAESDEQRITFLERFYDLNQELPETYDLVVNTDSISKADASDLILSLVSG